MVIVGLLVFSWVSFDIVWKLNFLMEYRTLLYGVAGSFLVLGLAQAEKNGKIYGAQRWVQLLGDSSYALYLIHFPLISVLCKVLVRVGFNRYDVGGALFSYFIILFICVISAVLFHLWIERALMTFFRKKI